MASAKTNFLFIITDQQCFDHVGYIDNAQVRTPCLDALARQGRCYKHAYVSSPLCQPSRASILTGRMPSLHGVRHNGIAIDRNAVTFVDLLRDAGYNTALIGKSHFQNFIGQEPAYKPKWQNSLPTHLPPSIELSEAVRGRVFTDPFYETELFSKWEDDPDRKVPLPYYGFDEVKFCIGHGDRVSGHYRAWLDEKCPEFVEMRGITHASIKSDLGTRQVYCPAVPEEFYPSSYVAEMAENYLDNVAKTEQAEPFFLWCGFPDPHHPFTPPGRYWDAYQRSEIKLPESFYSSTHDQTPPLAWLKKNAAELINSERETMPFMAEEEQAKDILARTYGQIELIDAAIARILSSLQRNGLKENTVIIFTSDHGDWMGSHGLFLKGPLHYQKLIRVPLIWNDPHRGKSEQTVDSITSNIDLSVSILSRAGLQPGNGMQGVDLNSDSAKRESVVVEQTTQFPYLGFDRIVSLRTLVSHAWRLTVWDDFDWGELYDLTNDSDELTNLWDSASHQGIKKDLMHELIQQMMNNQDESPFPTDRA